MLRSGHRSYYRAVLSGHLCIHSLIVSVYHVLSSGRQNLPECNPVGMCFVAGVLTLTVFECNKLLFNKMTSYGPSVSVVSLI